MMETSEELILPAKNSIPDQTLDNQLDVSNSVSMEDSIAGDALLVLHNTQESRDTPESSVNKEELSHESKSSTHSEGSEKGEDGAAPTSANSQICTLNNSSSSYPDVTFQPGDLNLPPVKVVTQQEEPINSTTVPQVIQSPICVDCKGRIKSEQSSPSGGSPLSETGSPVKASTPRSQRHLDFSPRCISCQRRTTSGNFDGHGVSPAKMSPKHTKLADVRRGFIDTTAPFESVKEAVSKFGGIVDWKAHKVHTVEKRKLVEEELERVQSETPDVRKRLREAKESKIRVLKELESTKRLVEELKLDVARAQTEELQAKQDLELEKLRLQEIEQGITDDASAAAKAQLDVAKERHAAAVAELKFVNEELEKLHQDHALLAMEKDEAEKKAEEAVSAAKEYEREVGDLTVELISVKESLETAQAAHMEAEEQRIGVTNAKEQDALQWEEDLKQVEEEIQTLNEQIILCKDLKSKLESSTVLLSELKAELAAYTESRSRERDGSGDDDDDGSDKQTRSEMQQAVFSARKELEEVKHNIVKATSEVDSLKAVAASLQSELGEERSSIAMIKQREGMAEIVVASLESEVEKINSEIAAVKKTDEEIREKMSLIHPQLQEAESVADDARSAAEISREKLDKAAEELQHIKASARTTDSKLLAAQKEIPAARASESLALSAAKALQGSEAARDVSGVKEPPECVTLSIEEFNDLRRHAEEAEEKANQKVAAALCQVADAKDSESRIMKRLEEAYEEMAVRRRELRDAMEKAEKAKEGKLGVEQELRQWRAEHEQRRKAGDSGQGVSAVVEGPKPVTDDAKDFNRISDVSVYYSSSPKSYLQEFAAEENASQVTSSVKKKKKSFFPRILMFLARKRAHSRASKAP